jgi:hypothetical protein
MKKFAWNNGSEQRKKKHIVSTCDKPFISTGTDFWKNTMEKYFWGEWFKE